MYQFEDIIGQNHIVGHIQQAIKVGQISHAYIFEGEKGMGKKLISSTFAKTLQCKAGGLSPCNACDSCINFDGGNHPDIKFVKPTKKTGYGVSDIREQVNGDIHIKPYVYPYKIYIIDQAELLTVQAQNALLKTIEEPPSYVIIMLLTANNQSLLQTILSRCVKISMSPVSKKVIGDYLIARDNISDYESTIYASFARGNIGKALQLLEDETFSEIREKVILVFHEMVDQNTYRLMESAKEFDAYKDKVDVVFDVMLSWLRDLMVFKSTNEEKHLIHGDKYQTLMAQSENLSYNKISMLVDRIEETKSNFRLHANYQLSFETLFLL